MTFSSARVTLKQHRIEIAMGALAALAFAIWGAVVEIRTAMVSVPPGCFDVWRSAGPDGAGQCLGPIRAWAQALATDGDTIVHAMAYVPFGIGLLVSVPIVAGELEARTAQTAWALFGSRLRWLAHQMTPILIVLGVAMILLAISTGVLEGDRVFFGYSPVEDLGRFGWTLLPRWWAALGIGLLAGALVGRSLPAFVLGAVGVAGLVMAIGLAHQTWIDGLTPTVITADGGGGSVSGGTVITAVAWRSPTGTLVPLKDALAIAHAGGAPRPGPGDPQDSPAIDWLQQHGYAEVDLGVSRETALGWAVYEALLFMTAGGAAVGGAVWELQRRRPT